MNPTLTIALEYARTHKTTVWDTADALRIPRNALAQMLSAEARAGRKVKWPVYRNRQTMAPGETPLDIVRHVRNGTPFWQEVRPMSDPRRGPSRPVMPAPSNAAERPWTAAGLASALDKRPALVDLARRFYGLPVHMTDAEAHTLTAALDQK